MRELALSTLAELERAQLAELATAVHQRVFSLNADVILKCHEENNIERWRFRPMAELLLRELRDVALDEKLPLDLRRRRIEWALDMSGY